MPNSLVNFPLIDSWGRITHDQGWSWIGWHPMWSFFFRLWNVQPCSVGSSWLGWLASTFGPQLSLGLCFCRATLSNSYSWWPHFQPLSVEQLSFQQHTLKSALAQEPWITMPGHPTTSADEVFVGLASPGHRVWEVLNLGLAQFLPALKLQMPQQMKLWFHAESTVVQISVAHVGQHCVPSDERRYFLPKSNTAAEAQKQAVGIHDGKKIASGLCCHTNQL